MDSIIKATLVEQVASKLKTQILDGTYRAGEQLPSCRDLAASTGVSHETVRAALQHLVARGYIVARPRTAMRVASLRTCGGLEVLLDMVCSVLGGGRDRLQLIKPLEDLEKLHRIVFAEAASLASSRHARRDEEALLLAMGALETQLARGRPEQLLERQAEVVAAISSAAGSHCFGFALNSIHRIWAEAARHVELAECNFGSLPFFDPLEKAILDREAPRARSLVLDRAYPGWPEIIAQLRRADTAGSQP